MKTLTHGRAYQLIFPEGEETAIENAKAASETRKAEKEKAVAEAVSRDAAGESLHKDRTMREAV